MRQRDLRMLQFLLKHENWLIITRLADRPATIEQLMAETGFTRNKVLAITRILEGYGLVKRPPRSRDGITGLMVATQPEHLSNLLNSIRGYVEAVHQLMVEEAEAEVRNKFKTIRKGWDPVVHQGGKDQE